MAISDVLASVVRGFGKPEEVVDTAAPATDANYTRLYFRCWLCDGKTDFAYKNTSQKKEFTIECTRCGVENRVTLS